MSGVRNCIRALVCHVYYLTSSWWFCSYQSRLQDGDWGNRFSRWPGDQILTDSLSTRYNRGWDHLFHCYHYRNFFSIFTFCPSSGHIFTWFSGIGVLILTWIDYNVNIQHVIIDSWGHFQGKYINFRQANSQASGWPHTEVDVRFFSVNISV